MNVVKRAFANQSQKRHLPQRPRTRNTSHRGRKLGVGYRTSFSSHPGQTWQRRDVEVLLSPLGSLPTSFPLLQYQKTGVSSPKQSKKKVVHAVRKNTLVSPSLEALYIVLLDNKNCLLMTSRHMEKIVHLIDYQKNAKPQWTQHTHWNG